MKKLLLFFITCLSLTGLNAQNIHFAHVTDSHVGSHTGAIDLRETVKDLNIQDDIQFVLLTGDLTEFGSDAELTETRQILGKLNKPWYVLPGNHDSKWSESGNNSFVTIFGAEKFAFEKEGFLFLGTASGPTMRMAPGLVPREQLSFIDSVLFARKSSREPVIFVNHYPLDESLSNWYDIIDKLKSVNIQSTLLGHGHVNRLFDFEGIPGIMGRSNLRTSMSGAGYNLVNIENDTIYYRERRSSGITIPCWCKVPLKKDNKFNSPDYSKSPASAVVPEYKRPDYTINMKYPEVKTDWIIQEKSDVGTGLAGKRNQAIFANTAGEIVSINIHSGRKNWTFKTHGKVYATPAIKGNKVICASTDHNIYCLDRQTGELIWMHPTIKPIVASPAIEGNRIYIGSSDGSFRCINLSTGNIIWSFDSVSNFVECKPLILKKSVNFGSWGNAFYSLDKESGQLLWKREKYSNRMLSPAAVWPVAGSGKIFIVAPDRHITALDENSGQEIWDSQKYSCRESIGISKDGKLVYLKNMTEGNLDAFYSSPNTQELAWECKADMGYEIAPSPPVESGDYLYVPTSTGIVVAINRKTHLVVWKHKVSNAMINAVLPIGRRRILVSVLDGEIAALSF